MMAIEPPERDVKDFDFIQLCKFRTAPSDPEITNHRVDHLACSSQFGLLFYVTKEGFSAVKTSSLMAVDEDLGKERTKTVIEDIPIEAKVSLQGPVFYIDVSSDGKTLVVVLKEMGQISLLFYDINVFGDKTSPSASFAKAMLSTAPNCTPLDVAFNPTFFDLMAICTSDGVVQILSVRDRVNVISSQPAATGATCFCWSPKGKQLLVGKKDGTFTQYDHAMAEKRQWPCPGVLTGPHRATDVVWQSTYVFMASYLPITAQPLEQPVVVMTSSNKEGNSTFVNFDDVCYGRGDERSPQYFLHFVQKWELILMSSRNATETTLVGKNLDNKTSWDHWNLEDCSRAELPLTSDQNDTYPTGMAVDYSPQKPLILGETKSLPACPVMYLLSTDGILIGYHLAYSHRDAVPTTEPARALNPAEARRAGPELAAPSRPMFPQSPLTQAPTDLAPPQTIPAAVTTFAHNSPNMGGTSIAPASSMFAPPGLQGNLPPSQPSVSSLFSSLGQLSTTKPSIFSSSGQASTIKPLTSMFSPAPQATAASHSIFGQPKPTGILAFGTANASTVQSSAFAFVPSSVSSDPASSQLAQQTAVGTASFTGQPVTSSAVSTSAQPASGPLQEHLLTGKPQSGSLTMGTVVAAQPTTTFGSGPAQSWLSAATKVGLPAQPMTAMTSAGQSAFAGLAQQTPEQGPGKAISQHTPVTGINTAPQMSGLPRQTPAPQTTGIRASPGEQVPASVLVCHTETQKTIEATVDNAFTQNIREEIADFEKELQEFRVRSCRDVKSVGTREEIQILRQNTEKISNFLKEIKETTKEQSRETQEQKGTCFNLFSMAEDCKTKLERDNDPHYHSLLLSRVLDPTSLDKLRSLQQMSQAIEQNVVEVDRTMDHQWEEHIKNKKTEERLHTPTGDTIYKSIRNSNVLINTQRRHLEKVEEQLRNLKLYREHTSREIPDLDLSISSKLYPLKEMTKPDMTLSKAMNIGMTPEKITQLRDVITQRKVCTVKSVVPANLSRSRIVSLATANRTRSAPGQVKPAERAPAQHQTPTGIPGVQLRIQKGLGSLPDPPKPGPPVASTASQPVSQSPAYQSVSQSPAFQSISQTPAYQPVSQSPAYQPVVQGSDGGPVAKIPAAPTNNPNAFSGVASFKQDHEVSTVQQHGPGISPLASVMYSGPYSPQTVESSPLPQHAPQTVESSPLPQHIPQTVESSPQHTYYENVTPTETDETNDEDDDDYDEEDNGYEDEDEDEEETGFVGLNRVQDGPSGQPVPGTFASFSFDGRTGATTQDNNLFKLPASGPVAKPANTQAFSSLGEQDSGHGDTSSTKTTSAKDLFGAKATLSGSGILAPPAIEKSIFGQLATKTDDLTSQAGSSSSMRSGSVGFNFSMSKAATPVGNPKSLDPEAGGDHGTEHTGVFEAGAVFGQKVNISSGFAFGGGTVFGQKGPTAGSGSLGGGNVFGSLATPSKGVGFSDLAGQCGQAGATTSMLSALATKADSGTRPADVPSLQQSAVPTPALPSSTMTTATASLTATATSSVTPTVDLIATPSPATTPSDTLFGGEPHSASKMSPFTTSGDQPQQPSVFGGKSPPDSGGGMFSFGLTPSSSAGTGHLASTFSFTAVAASTSPLSDRMPDTSTTTTGLQAAGTAFSFTTAAASMEKNTPSSVSVTASLPPQAGTTQDDKPTSAPENQEMQSSTTTDSKTAEGFSFGDTSTSSATADVTCSTSTAATAPPEVGTTAKTTSVTTTASPAAETSLFGGGEVTSTVTTTAAGPFGSGVPVFGQNPGTASTTPSAFGFSTPEKSTTTAAASVFCGFGSSSTATPSSATSVAPLPFGSTTPSVTLSSTGQSVFGGAGAGSSSSSTSTLFGSTPQTTTGGFGFGSLANTGGANTGSVFGGVSGQSTPTGSAGGTSVFGSGTNTASSTGGGGGLFGSAGQQGSSGFGQGSSSSSGFPFGQTPSSGGAGFGPPSSAFGQQSSSSFEGFGLGGKPSEEKAKQNVFGVPQSFGSARNQTQQSLFGSGMSTTFGGSGSSFPTSIGNVSPQGGSGAFASGSGGVGSSGFGVSANTSAGSGFGSAPSFGGSPSFGSTAAFGVAQTGGFGSSTNSAFGGSPAFGSTPAFSSPTAGSSSTGGFSGFANTPAPSFGQLAQSFPSTSAFGGTGSGAGFGSPQAQPSLFGASANTSGGGGGFGSSQPFGGGGTSLFGQASSSPGFGGGQTPSSPGFGGGQTQGFGSSPAFSGNPAFSSYRG